MHIGTVKLTEKPLFLAPMEDVTDPSFRYICKNYGADVVYTEFVPSDALIRDAAKSKKKLEIFDYERPVGIQLYGHIIESMVESAKIVEEVNPDIIDINYGCPVRKIATRGAGAGMLRDIPKMIQMTSEIVKAVKKPVTVKTRLGWDDESKHIVEIAERLQDVGIAALTIHGRTRTQLYRGQADWTLIGDVKNNPRMHIPIIGNGDIKCPEDAKNAFDTYGVDGIMIGRAAIGHPWIFKHTRHYIETGILLPEPDINERVDLCLMQLQRSLEWKGSPRGIYEMRRHYCNYFKSLPNFKEFRQKLVTETEPDEIKKILERIRGIYGEMLIISQDLQIKSSD